MATRRIHQRQVLALLLAIAALVVPVSGALVYAGLLDGMEDGPSRVVVPFMGAANSSDLLGPALLAGALGLGVLALRGRADRPVVSVPMLGTILVVAALSQGSAFLVTAIDLLTEWTYGLPGDAWQAVRWSTAARLVVQALLCAAVAAFSIRWLNPDERRSAT